MIQELNKRVEQKLISVQQHDTLPLLIWNYTQMCQFSKSWDEYTMMCRGLITDLEGNIVARPFKKFFNLGEQKDLIIPKDKPIVTKKYDGSLGVLYWNGKLPCIATRGSFNSKQAAWATSWIQKFYIEEKPIFDKDKTYLFEIIFKENRIVVDYNFEGLILLAVIETKTGKDIFPLPELGIKKTEYYEDIDLQKLARILQEGLTQKDFREYIHTTKQGMENMQGLQVGELQKGQREIQKFQKSQHKELVQEARESEEVTGVPQGRVQKNKERYRGCEKCSMYGLRNEISLFCDGFRPCEGKETDEYWTNKKLQESDRGNEEVRGCMCELPQSEDLQQENEEGFVVLYPSSGLRLKIKYAEYVRLHKLLTEFSSISIWECLRDGTDIEEMLERVPDEFYKWVHETRENLMNQFHMLWGYSKLAVEGLSGSRKDKAIEILKMKPEFRPICFAVLDNKNPSSIIWRQLKPKYQKPFSNYESTN